MPPMSTQQEPSTEVQTGALPPVRGGLNDTAALRPAAEDILLEDPPLEAALGFLARGWSPIPLCWATPEGACGCGRGHQGNNIGKAPLLGAGYQTLRPTEADVRRWWTEWPRANVGLLLEPSGLVFVGPDSPEGLDYVQEHGVPPTAIRHSAHSGYLYARPGNCPLTTTKLLGGGLDLKANGYVVAHGTHRSGAAVYVAFPESLVEAPLWVVESLRAATSAVVPGTPDPEKPPVRLDEQSLSLWRGEVAAEADGTLRPREEAEVDRSLTLFLLGEALAAAGASHRGIVDALADRDRALGYAKYSARRDDGAEYARIARKVLDPSRGRTMDRDGDGGHLEPIGRVVPGHPPARPRMVCAEDLRQRGAPELDYLPLLEQSEFIVKGWCTLVAGYPKAGKTELVVRLCHAWGEERILYITEEPESIWCARLAGLPDGWGHVTLLFGLGVEPAVLLEEIHASDATVVVIDTVRNLLRLRDETDNSEVARVLTPVIVACRGAGQTLVLLHHIRKGGGEHGEGITGGHAFLGIVDAALEITRDQNLGKHRRKVRGWGRVAPIPELVYELGEDGTMRALGDPRQVSLEAVKERALEVLGEEWAKTRELLGALDEPRPSDRQFREALKALVAEGRVERDPAEVRRGATYQYRLPQRSAPGTDLPIGSRCAVPTDGKASA